MNMPVNAVTHVCGCVPACTAQKIWRASVMSPVTPPLSAQCCDGCVNSYGIAAHLTVWASSTLPNPVFFCRNTKTTTLIAMSAYVTYANRSVGMLSLSGNRRRRLPRPAA